MTSTNVNPIDYDDDDGDNKNNNNNIDNNNISYLKKLDTNVAVDKMINKLL